MPKKVQLKTAASDASVGDYLDRLEPEAIREEAMQLDRVFRQTTGAEPGMWGESIVGYGRYIYYRSNGDEGEFMATGFSMRKSGPVIYIMPGYNDYSKLLADLGPHKLGKSCLYLKSLKNIDLDVLSNLIKQGLADLDNTHRVEI